MDLRYMFLATLDDLRSKIDGEKYDLIRACGLIRHIFLDKPSVFDQICKQFGMDYKILFAVNQISDNAIEKGVLLNWSRIRSFNNNTPKVTLHEFYKINCLTYFDENFTVKEIINACAHVLGGVHSYKPNPGKEERLSEWIVDSRFEFSPLNEKFGELIKGDEMAFLTIRDICEICVEALRPYEEKLKSGN